MTTILRNTGAMGVTGNISRTKMGGRNAHCRNDGSAVVVIADPNDSAASAGYGERNNTSKIYVYSSTDRATWTLRTTITTAVALAKPNSWTSELFPDNTLAIVYLGVDNSIRYHPVTTAWAAGASETVLAGVAGVTPMVFDIDTSDGGVPSVAVVKHSTSGTTRSVLQLITRRTSDSLWTSAVSTTLITSDTPDPANVVASLSILKGGAAATRNVVMLGGSGVAATGDNGVTVFTSVLNETTGAASAPTARVTLAAGDIPVNHGLDQFVHKGRLFTDAVGRVTVGIVSCRTNTGTMNAKLIAARYTWDGTTFGAIVPATTTVVGYAFNPGLGMEITYGTDGLNFIFSIDSPPADGKYDHINYFAKFNTDGTVLWGGRYNWANFHQPMYHHAHMHGNGQTNTGFDTHDTIFHVVVSGSAYAMHHNYLAPVQAPASATPAAGSTINSSIPSVSAGAKIGIKYPQSSYKIVWQFASDSGFTTNVKDFEQDNSKFQSIPNTDVTATVVQVIDKLPSNLSLPQGNWFMRAAHVDMTGRRSAWTATQALTVAHQPAASNLQPSLNQLVKFDAANGASFVWTFTDPSPDDYQTAFQVVIQRVSDNSTVYDSGKIASQNMLHTVVFAAGYKDVALRWQVRLWDRDNVAGPYSTGATFTMGDPPTVAFISPTGGATLTSANPTIQLSCAVASSRIAKLYRVTVSSGNTVVYDSGLQPAGNQSGAFQINHVIPTGYLQNNSNYTVSAFIVDSASIHSATASVAVATLWGQPASPTGLAVDATKYNVQDQANIKVSWNDAARDVNYIAWVIYRKDDMLDPNSLTVIEPGTWQIIGYDSTIRAGYSYLDPYAPPGYAVSYRMTQLVDRYGDQVESAPGPTLTVYPKSDGYWLINPDTPQSPYSATRLSSVTGDSYTDEYEESEYTIVGRGRHVDRGEHLGLKGTLDLHLRDSSDASARQKKRRIEAMKAANFTLYMRTPFGDIYNVYPGNISVTRISGVGLSEFCDVSIPYSEVGA